MELALGFDESAGKQKACELRVTMQNPAKMDGRGSSVSRTRTRNDGAPDRSYTVSMDVSRSASNSLKTTLE